MEIEVGKIYVHKYSGKELLAIKSPDMGFGWILTDKEGKSFYERSNELELSKRQVLNDFINEIR